MNFSKQLKKYRELNQLSQEKLAEKIYVTRQTISKWENDKSYPDIHNLVALSALFDISLDELIKGDVPVMKHVIKNEQMSKYAWGMLLFLLLALIIGVPSVWLWGVKGFIPMGILWLISMYFAYRIEKIKKQHNLKTYQEIVAFTENKTATLEDLQKNRNQKKYFINKTLLIIRFGLIAAVLGLLVVWMTGFFLS